MPDLFYFDRISIKNSSLRQRRREDVERSDDRRVHKRAPPTHPDYATLLDPLFAFGGKRVQPHNPKKSKSLSRIERVVERSNDRVS